jgi:hypothetical protein
MFIFSLFFVDPNNAASLIKNLMEHFQLVVVHHPPKKAKAKKKTQKVILLFLRTISYFFVFLDVCNKPKVTGLCKAALPRFYYNSATKNCESFTYGGCGSNGNNFATKGLCETACKA